MGVGLFPNALLPVNNVCVLATWSAFIMNTIDVVTFTVMPFPGSVTFANAPGYVDGNDFGIVVPCGVSTVYPYGNFCAAIYTPDHIISNADMTWGCVYALYR